MRVVPLALVAALAAASLAACGTPGQRHMAGPGVPALEVENFHAVDPGLAASAAPTDEQFAAAASLGYRTAVDFRPIPEGESGDRDRVVSRGMDYVNIPVSKDDLGFEQADRLAELLESSPGRPVLMYCNTGNRVGAVWALYLAKYRGVEPGDALGAGERAGLTKLEPRVRELLESR